MTEKEVLHWFYSSLFAENVGEELADVEGQFDAWRSVRQHSSHVACSMLARSRQSSTGSVLNFDGPIR